MKIREDEEDRSDSESEVTEWSKDAIKKQKNKNHTSQPGSRNHM